MVHQATQLLIVRPNGEILVILIVPDVKVVFDFSAYNLFDGDRGTIREAYSAAALIDSGHKLYSSVILN